MLRWDSADSKDRLYYALAGTGCCFCPTGADIVVWRSPTPLGTVVPLSQYGMVYALVWSGGPRHSSVQCLYPNMVWYDMVWCGMEVPDTPRYSSAFIPIWYGMVWYERIHFTRHPLF